MTLPLWLIIAAGALLALSLVLNLTVGLLMLIVEDEDPWEDDEWY